MIGTRLGHYKITRSLGRGGMGEVWAAEDTKLGRQVALKLLSAEMAADPERRARFEREARAVAALDHPNIVTVHSIEEADGHHFITMQLVEGHTLADVVDGTAGEGVSLEQFFDIAIPLAEAVSGAHGHDIAHRDLKPANVMITPDGRVLVLDFGLAKMLATSGDEDQTLGPAATLTGEGKIMGTVAYMSPEQAEGRAIDERSDLFSLGVILYELSTGQRPFVGDTQMSILTSIIRDTPTPVSELRAALPRHLGRIVRHCLEKTPERRMQSATALRNELEDLRQELRGGSMPPTSNDDFAATSLEIEAPEEPTAVAKPTARRWLPAVAAVVVLVLVGAWWISGSAARRERSETLDRLNAMAGEGRLDDVHDLLLTSGVGLEDADAAALADEFAGALVFALEPASTTVLVQRATPVETFADRTGQASTPVSGTRMIAGEYLLRLTAPNHEPLLLTVTIGAGAERLVQNTLMPTTDANVGMVRVAEGPSPLDPALTVTSFLIDAREVTKADYLAFIADGGYRDEALWPDSMLIDEMPTSSEQARAVFVDRTGVPGPRQWSGGRYAEGTGDHPVTGISWYEAGAYALWRGKLIPDRHQWWRAAVDDGTGIFPWGNEGRTAQWRANFERPGTTAVGSYPLGASPFGLLDMAGNVREWLRGSEAEPSWATGGSWQDPIYTFDPAFTERFSPDTASDSIGLRLVMTGDPEA